MTPRRNITQSQLIPPEIQHFGFASQYSFARNAFWRGHQCIQPVIYPAALRLVYSRKQVPQCKRVVLARVGQYRRKFRITFLRTTALKIKFE